MKWKLFVDGASRSNPGPSGAGAYLVKSDGYSLELSFFLGTKTNNQAEYLALILGLLESLPVIKDGTLEILSDSQLLVKQVLGQYRVKDTELKKLHQKVLAILSQTNYTIKHVLRDKNKDADRLANKAVDNKIKIPANLLQKLKQYELVV